MDRYGGYGAIVATDALSSPYQANRGVYPPPIQRYGEPPWAGDSDGIFSMARDAETLARMLTPLYVPVDAPIATQLFAGHGRVTKISLEHLANLIHERSRLHQRHIADINHRHMQTQERLFGARLHGRLDGYRNALRLEQMLAQLEEQKRREELQFWNDTMEIREKMFQQAADYHALRHRMDLFAGLEPGGEGHV